MLHGNHCMEINLANNELWFGLPGTTDNMPDDGFDIETVISYSDQGFYEGVQKVQKSKYLWEWLVKHSLKTLIKSY